MTGYGRGTAIDTENSLRIEVEMTSLNRKNLDLQLTCPRDWNGLEQMCKTWITDTFQRGRLNIQVKATSTQNAQSHFEWNPETMDASLQQLRNYANSRNIDFTIDGHLLLSLAKTLKEGTLLPEWRVFEDSIRTAFDTALVELNAMRLTEGTTLANDLRQRIRTLDLLRKSIAEHEKNAASNYQATLIERLRKLQLDLDLHDERVLKEIALFADRCDISEELTRLSSHFEQFNEFILDKNPVGRKLDFLCQEIHREFNTISSKATSLQSTRAVMDAKNELERIREQVQNIE